MTLVRWFVVSSAIAALCCAGCHRGYYRRQADAEVYALIRQKANDPRWDLPNTTIEVKPESRMHDPFSADHPPLPPDDPASAKLMQVVDDKPGYSHWHANGDTDYVESPDWMSYLPMDENGFVIIDSQRAVELALTHSSAYQRQREDLYLAALDVSLQRFGFDTQGFWGLSSNWRHQGRGGRSNDPSTPADESTFSSSTFDISPLANKNSLSRQFATGAEFVVGLANAIMWQFAGPNSRSATTVVDFAITQPLLRRAGRDVVLESLTQVERTLLASVRQFERFRQSFFLQVSTGGGSTGGGTGSGAAGGLLGLLRAQQSIRIQEFNVASLRNVLNQFIEFRKAERIDSLQLTQVETTLYNSERDLLAANTNYDTQLDLFKRTLGLPPDLKVEIRDTFLKQFELIDDENNGRQFELNSLKAKTGDTLLDVSALIESSRYLIEQQQPEIAPENAADPEKALEALRQQQELELTEEFGIRWSDELEQKLNSISPLLDEISPLLQSISKDDVQRIRSDFETLRNVRPRRAAALKRLRAAIQSGIAGPIVIEPAILEETSLEDPDRLTEQLALLEAKLLASQTSLDQLKQTLQTIISQGNQADPKDLYQQIDERILSAIPKQLTDLASLSIELSLLQARARTDSIELAGVDLDPAEAIQIARCCRLDWMNARASLVDSWRQIEVVADDLESQLDLVFNGSMGNDGRNPFRLDYGTRQLSAGLRFDSPITRLAERNNYRRQLITYQRDRRVFYEFEDEAKRQLRATLRNIELNKILFELARRSIKVSVQQVELARFRLEAPPQGIGGGGAGGGTGGTGGAGRTQLGATTARDLTDALNGLLNSQNSFLNVWVTFEVLRRDLDFNLGTLQLTDDGYWIDPGTIDRSIGIACGANLQSADGGFPDIPTPRSAIPVEIRIEPMPNSSDAAPNATPQPATSGFRPRFQPSSTLGEAAQPDFIQPTRDSSQTPEAKPVSAATTILAPGTEIPTGFSSDFAPADSLPADAMSSSSDLFLNLSRLPSGLNESQPQTDTSIRRINLNQVPAQPTQSSTPTSEQGLPTFSRLFRQSTGQVSESSGPGPSSISPGQPIAEPQLSAPEIIQTSVQISQPFTPGSVQPTVWQSQPIGPR